MLSLRLWPYLPVSGVRSTGSNGRNLLTRRQKEDFGVLGCHGLGPLESPPGECQESCLLCAVCLVGSAATKEAKPRTNPKVMALCPFLRKPSKDFFASVVCLFVSHIGEML